MRYVKWYWLVGFVLMGIGTSQGQALFSPEVQKIADKYVSKKKNHALIVGIIYKDSAVIKGFGQMSALQAYRPDAETIFEIGAVTNAITATAMMMESQAGKFHIDDPINQFLPSDIVAPLYAPFVCRYEEESGALASGDDYGRMICEPDPFALSLSISFCDLASHTSGLANAPKGLYVWNPFRTNKLKKDAYQGFSREELYENLYRNVLMIPPGSIYTYSNGGMALLGNLLADLNDKSYESLVKDLIFRPLGMQNTAVHLTEDQHKKLAIGHRKNGKTTAHWNFNAMAPAAGLHATASDLVRFVQANLVAPNETFEHAFIQAHQARIDVPKHRTGRETSGGYGWLTSIISESNLPVVWVNGGTGGFRSYIGFMKDLDVGIVVLSNSANSVDEISFEILKELSKIYYKPKIRQRATAAILLDEFDFTK